jgi:hypothetical protein
VSDLALRRRLTVRGALPVPEITVYFWVFVVGPVLAAMSTESIGARSGPGVFTAVLIVTFAAQRISGGMPTGLGIADGLLSSKAVFAGLRVVLALLSIGAGYMVFRTGDLGAKAVWQGRLQATDHGFPGGPGAGEPGLFSPLGNGAPSRRPSHYGT